MMNFEEMTTDELWAALPDAKGIEKGYLLLHLMSRAENSHEHETSITLATQAAKVFLQHGSNRDFAHAKAYEGDGYLKVGNFEQAALSYETSINNLDPLLDINKIALVHQSYADAMFEMFQFKESLLRYRLATEMFIEQNLWDCAANVQSRVSRISLTLEDGLIQINEAQKHYDLAKISENSNEIMNALQNLAHAQVKNGLISDALKSSKDALVLANLCECDRCKPEALLEIGIIHFEAELFDDAKKYFLKAKSIFKSQGQVKVQLLIQTYLAEILIESNPKKAVKKLKIVLRALEHLEFPAAKVRVGKVLANYYIQREKGEKALVTLEKVLPVAIQNGLVRDECEISMALCVLLIENHEFGKARSILKRIEPTFVGNKLEFQALLMKLSPNYLMGAV